MNERKKERQHGVNGWSFTSSRLVKILRAGTSIVNLPAMSDKCRPSGSLQEVS